MNLRFQNRRMKWRNTKEREIHTSTNSICNEKNGCSDCEQKDEIITYDSSVLEDESDHSDIEENN
jgi:hypothetical protein